MHLIITLLTAFTGGIAALKMKIPAGAIIGSILSVAFINIAFGIPEIPIAIRVFTQILAGAFIGSRLTSKNVNEIKNLALPALILITTLMLSNIVLGLGLYFTSPLDLCTSLFAVVPGGITEMSVIADDMGADIAVVGLFQIARLLATLCLFPFIIARIMKSQKNGSDVCPVKYEHNEKIRYGDIGVSLLISAAAGILGRLSGFPGGTLLFSVTATGYRKAKTDKGNIPKTISRIAQVLTGAYVGAKISIGTIQSFLPLWPYVLIFVIINFITCLLSGLLMSRLSRLDKITAVFCCTPAGSTDMALIASEFVEVTTPIAVLQLVRVIGVIGLFPSMIALILRLYL